MLLGILLFRKSCLRLKRKAVPFKSQSQAKKIIPIFIKKKKDALAMQNQGA